MLDAVPNLWHGTHVHEDHCAWCANTIEWKPILFWPWSPNQLHKHSQEAETSSAIKDKDAESDPPMTQPMDCQPNADSLFWADSQPNPPLAESSENTGTLDMLMEMPDKLAEDTPTSQQPAQATEAAATEPKQPKEAEQDRLNMTQGLQFHRLIVI